MKQSMRHFVAAALCAFSGVVLIVASDSQDAASFLFDYGLAFLLFGGVHRAVEDKQ